MRLFHFSENPEIRIFHPRPPVAYPDERPAVYAIDDLHQPLYFFPRDCPRIGVWPVETTSETERDNFKAEFLDRGRDAREDVLGTGGMVFYADDSWRSRIEAASIWRYEFPIEGFMDCHDHGCFIAYELQTPIQVECLQNLPERIAERNCKLSYVDLLAEAERWLQPTTLHVSMVRMRNLLGWNHEPGTPVRASER